MLSIKQIFEVECFLGRFGYNQLGHGKVRLKTQKKKGFVFTIVGERTYQKREKLYYILGTNLERKVN